MGATAAVHPAEPSLQAYGLGMRDDFSSKSASQHLEGCDSRQRRVPELSADEFLGRLQDARGMREKSVSGWSPSAGSSTEGTSGQVGQQRRPTPSRRSWLTTPTGKSFASWDAAGWVWSTSEVGAHGVAPVPKYQVCSVK